MPADSRRESSGAGEPGAPALLAAYQAHRDGLLTFCAAVLRNRDDAEDAVQEAFARSAEAIVAGRCEPGPYLYMVARNICRDLLRRRRRRDLRPLADDISAGGSGPEQVALARACLDLAWASISPRDRLLLAHSLAGFAYQEIADRSGLSAKSVSVGLVRARDRVRRVVGSGSVAAVIGTGMRAPLRRLRAWWWRGQHHVANDVWQITTWRGSAELASVLAAGCLLCAGQGVAPAPGTSPRVAAPAALVGAGTTLSGADHVVAARTLPPTHARAAFAAATPSTSQGAAPPPIHYDDGNLTTGPTQSDIYAVTASPDYAHDHTLFAEGRQSLGMTRLFRSTDGGQTWVARPAVGFAGGVIVLPAAWPADHRMFAGTTAGLQESVDEGATWTLVAAIPGPIAIAPDNSGGYRIAIAASSLWTYDTTTGALQRGPLLPPDSLLPTSDVFAGDLDHVVVVAASRLETGTPDGLVIRCDLVLSCATVAVLPHQDGGSVVAPQGAVAQSFMVLGDQGAVYASRDGGRSFSTTDTGSRWASALAIGGGGSASAAIAYSSIEGSSVAQRVAVLSPDGAHFVDLATAVPTHWTIGSVLLLPGGRVLAVQALGAALPVAWRSDDGGNTWSSGPG